MKKKRVVFRAALLMACAALAYGVAHSIAPSRWTPDPDNPLPVALGIEADRALSLKRTAAENAVESILGAARELRLDDAITKYEKQLENDPQSALKHFQLGYAYLLRESYDYTEAMHEQTSSGERVRNGLRELRKALQLQPTLSAAAVTLGARYSVDDPSEAIRILQGVMKREPGNAEAMLWLTKAYTANPGRNSAYDEDTAIKWLKVLIVLRPTWYRPHLSLAASYVNKGRRFSANGKVFTVEPWRSQAIAEFKEVVRLPESSERAVTFAKAEITRLTAQPVQ